MREEQASFLEQQREVIIQQILDSIQRSGVLAAATVGSKKPSTKEKTSTFKLEKNLHKLVQHSLADSGLDYPHVRSTAHGARAQTAKEYSKSQVTECSTIKPIIRSRQEVEVSAHSSPSPAQTDQEAEQALPASSQEPTSLLSQSPLYNKEAASRKNRNREAQRRRHHRHNNSRSRAQVDEDYSEYTDPVDAAFAAVYKKVDLRTLAILDRSKVLLGQVRQPPTDGKTSFVEKLRQRYANSEPRSDRNPSDTKKKDENERECGNQPVEHLEECKKDDVDIEEKTSPDGIRCDLELLQPPSKAPDNDNEWENELARQILTIYATSVKAKALEKANANSFAREQSDNLSSAGHSDRRQLHNSGTANITNSRLKTSWSLPAIGKSSTVKPTKQRQYPTAVNYSWEPSQLRADGKVIINMPKVPRPIWFAGTGAVKAVWCALADGLSQLQPQHSMAESLSVCDHRLCEEVRQLETKKKFTQCITTLESLLIALVRARGVDELETKLWKQLVVTCNAFASRCIDYQKFPTGLQLMKQAEHLIDNSILVDNTTRTELLAYLYDTYAHYYYKRRKPHAGLQYMMKAHEIHSRQSSWSHLAKCRLHIANLLSFQMKHVEAMRYMASILEMIEENKLEETSEAGGGGSAQKLCLAAVCYNNLAVEQLHMREFEAASVSSSNAQRLAKLCLSYSNRWLAQFQATSECVALAIATLMEDTNANQDPLVDCRSLTVAKEYSS